MKKLFAFVLFSMLVCALAFGLVACNAHTHEFGEWIVETPASCTQEGHRYRVCDCGLKEEEVLQKLPHTPVTVEGKAATCTEDGYTERVYCDVCSTEITPSQKIDRLGHSYGEYAHVVVDGEHYHTRPCVREGCNEIEEAACTLDVKEVAPTCYADGYTVTSCSVCQFSATVTHEGTMRAHKLGAPVFDEKTHNHTFSCEYEDCDYTLSAECSFEVFTVEPKCVTDGFTRYTCEECKGQYEEVITAPGHSYGAWVVDAKETCTEWGRQHRDCDKCEDVERKDVQPLGHAWESAWTPHPEDHTHSRKCTRTECGEVDVKTCEGTAKLTPATCLAEGYKEFTCVDCHQQYKEKTDDALGHDWGDYVERTLPAVDGIEGSDMEGAHKHTHYQVCRRAGCSAESEPEDCELDFLSHRDANCFQAELTVTQCAKCKVKHEVLGDPAKGHTWGGYQNGGMHDHPFHFRQCTVCNYYDYSVYCSLEKVVKQPTCEEGGYTAYECTECKLIWRKTTVSASLGHDYGAYEYTGDNERHTHQRVCKRPECGHIEEGDCDMVPFDKAATCTAAGGSGTACRLCKASFTQNEYKQLDHVWQLTTNKTDDTHERTCVNCRTVEQVAHSYDEVLTPADCENPGYSTKTCSVCRYELKTQIEDQLAIGHSWKPWEITATSHKSECLTCHKVVDAPHDYSESNLCAMCEHDGMIYELQGDHYIVKPNAALKNTKRLVIKPYHDSGDEYGTVHPVTEIADYAFQRSPNLESVELPYTLQKIGKWAFYFCPQLNNVYINEEVVIPDPTGDPTIRTEEAQLTHIGDYAFMDDKALISLEAPKSLIAIGTMAFSHCISLTDISIPDTVEDIGSNAFDDTGYLKDESKWQDDCIYIGQHLIYARHHFDASGNALNKKIIVKSGTLTIAAGAFENCAYLEEVELPKTLIIVDADAFINCAALVSVTFDGNTTDWLNIHFVNDYSSPLHYATALHINEDRDSIVIPDSVTRIPAGTFRNTNIKQIVIPKSVTYIGANAFAGCTQLATITIEDDVVYIGKDAFKDTAYMADPANWDEFGAFYVGHHLLATRSADMKGVYQIRKDTVTIGIEAFANCTELEEIVIPKDVKRIGADVVKGCTALKRVTFEGEEEFFASQVPGIARVLDYERGLAYPTSACTQLKLYNGEWVWYKLYGKY